MKHLLLLAMLATAAFGQQTLQDQCARAIPQAFSVSSVSGNNQIVALNASGPMVICHISFNASTAVNIKLTTGTGTNCGTGTADLTGLYYNATGLVLPAFRIGTGVALCINFSGTVSAGGMYTAVAI